MVNVLLAFVTGLTTGGLSCLAVQGGLLASSLSHQIEQNLQNAPVKSKRKKQVQVQPARKTLAAPILAFLLAKLAAYTVLGVLLGLLGQMFQLSPFARAFLQIAIGIFMVGTALRMFNVHPIFRYFAFEPPAFIRRRLRKMGNESADSLAAPVFLGLLTVLIPCGVTQAMMAVALSTASPIEGGALMFAFTLGTSPVFFAVAYFATQLGSKIEKHFTRVAAAIILLLGVYAIDTGFALGGSPYTITRLVNDSPSSIVNAQGIQQENELQVFDPNPSGPDSPANPALPVEEGVVTINIKNTGYDPRLVHAPADVPVKLRLVSKNVYSCSLAFVIPSLGVFYSLEPTGEVFIEVPPQKKGTRMPFSCSMGMFTGVIVFDL
jgi:uncharacterized protein